MKFCLSKIDPIVAEWQVVYVVFVVFVVVVFTKVDLLAILADSGTVRHDGAIDRSLQNFRI